MLHLYVYYKVRKADAANMREAVEKVQARLSERTGLRFHLRRRRRGSDGSDDDTWMEIYEHVPAGFEQELDALIADAELESWTVGGRHIERFED